MNLPKELLISIASDFNAISNNERAIKMEAYMKNQFNFYGVDATQRKSIFKSHKQNFKLLDSSQINALCSTMWEFPQREWQYLALDFLDTLQKKNNKSSIILFEELILHKSWWDTVDGLASKQIGSYFLQFPKERDSFIEKWLASEDLWLKRTTLIFQLKYKNKVDLDLLQFLIGELKGNNDFFIQKAIGWSLRQVSIQHPQFVIDTVNKYDLSGIAKKESLRKIL